MEDGNPGSMKRMVEYHPLAQHYGAWLEGYDWKIYGCGTFRRPECDARAQALGKRFFERLERRLHTPVTYAAVMERRYSGCGLPSIAPHWHFLAASETPVEQMWLGADLIWKRHFGDALILPYDPEGDGAFYVAKLAWHENGVLAVRNLDRLEYHGPADLLEAARANPYVPDQLKDKVFGEYLVSREYPLKPRKRRLTPTELNSTPEHRPSSI